MRFRNHKISFSPFKGVTLYGLLVALYFFSIFFDFVSILPGISPARLTGVMLIFLCLLQGSRMRFEVDSVMACSYALLLFSTTPFLLMEDPASGFNGYSSLVINLAIFILVRALSFSEADLRLWAFALLLGAATMSVMMFISPGAVGHEWATDRTVVNIGGSQQDPNEFCGYLIFASAFLTYYSVRRAQYPLLALVIVFVYVALLTGSRSGLAAIFASCIAGLYFGWRGGRHKGAVIIIVTLLVILFLLNIDILIDLLPASIQERFVGVSLDSGTASYRMQAWRDVLSAFAGSSIYEQLLGHGFGATVDVTFNGLVAHNAFLEMLYACGLFGFAAYVGLPFALFFRVKRCGYAFSAAAIVGFLVLLMTMSATGLKACWVVWLLAAVQGDTVACVPTPASLALPPSSRGGEASWTRVR